MTQVLQDLHYAGRIIRKNPGFSALAVLTLALGIALNTSIFSTVNGVLLNPPPVADPDRAVMVVTTNLARGWEQSLVSAPDFREWQGQNHTLENMAAAEAYATATLSGDGPPEQVSAMRVSANFFSVLGVPPTTGRAFLAGEDARGKNHVVVLSHDLWRQRFGADPYTVGRSISIGGEAYTVIGIMPASFRLLIFPAQLWMPIGFSDEQLRPEARASRLLHVFARLKPGTTLKQAKAEFAALAERSARNYPESNKGWGANVESLQEFMVRDLNVRPALVVMMSAVGFILLLVSANLSSLLLTKVAARGREMAIRAAIGASRVRLVGQLLVESFVVSFLGGTLGLFLAFGGIHILRLLLSSMNRPGLAIAERLMVDGHVLLFTLSLSILTTFLFGLAPAVEGARVNVQSRLKSDSRAGGGSRNRLRSILVAAEITLALVLVMGTSILMTGIVQPLRLGLGFDPAKIIAADVSLSGLKYEDRAGKSSFFRQVIGNIEGLPGVVSAGAASNAAGTGARRVPFRIKGQPEASTSERPLARYYVVTDHYLQTMGIPLLRGRYFNDLDDANRPPVVVVNEVMARRFFGSEDALGKSIKVDGGPGESSPWREIVGIVANVKDWPGQVSEYPQIYECYWQRPQPAMTLVASANSDSGATAQAVRNAIWSADSDQAVGRTAPLSTIIAEEKAGDEIAIKLFGLFAVLALLLAAIGAYGVAASSVTQRTQEIGVRMAMGAQKLAIVRLILGGSARLTAIGAAIGLILSWPLPKIFTATFLDFHVNAAWIFVSIPILIGTIAMLACYFPALRASRIDPLVALRHE